MGEPTTFYNANCPVCSAGVAHVRHAIGGSDDLWVDINRQPDALRGFAIGIEAVKKRLHVIDREGVLRVGMPAVAALWDEIPRYRRLARIVRLPGVRQLAAVTYEALAIVLYAWNKRRERRRSAAVRQGIARR